jgi:hypothetical protein
MMPPAYGVRAMWSERSRHSTQVAWDRPWVSWEGCRPRRAFPATWLMPNRWHGGWYVAGHTLAAPSNQSSILGLHWVPTADRPQTRLKIDAQPASQSLMYARMTIRLSLTASSPVPGPQHTHKNQTTAACVLRFKWMDSDQGKLVVVGVGWRQAWPWGIGLVEGFLYEYLLLPC